MIPDLPAVQENFVVAQAGHVDAGFRDFAVNVEVISQVGGGVGLPRLTDSLILPAGARRSAMKLFQSCTRGLIQLAVQSDPFSRPISQWATGLSRGSACWLVHTLTFQKY